MLQFLRPRETGELQEDLGLTLITTVPNAAVRAGNVNPAVRPYLDLYPMPNGADCAAS